MFPSTLLKFSLCAIIASVVGVNAQAAGPVVCGRLPLAPLQDCEDVVDQLRKIDQFFPNDGGQANYTVASCMAKVLFPSPGGGIDASEFAENVEPIVSQCGTSDPMSGETLQGIVPTIVYQLFKPTSEQ